MGLRVFWRANTFWVSSCIIDPIFENASTFVQFMSSTRQNPLLENSV
jgi:hypothetical protein